MIDTPLIRFADVSKVYHLESGDFTALDHISLDIQDNEFAPHSLSPFSSIPRNTVAGFSVSYPKLKTPQHSSRSSRTSVQPLYLDFFHFPNQW